MSTQTNCKINSEDLMLSDPGRYVSLIKLRQKATSEILTQKKSCYRNIAYPQPFFF